MTNNDLYYYLYVSNLKLEFLNQYSCIRFENVVLFLKSHQILNLNFFPKKLGLYAIIRLYGSDKIWQYEKDIYFNCVNQFKINGAGGGRAKNGHLPANKFCK